MHSHMGDNNSKAMKKVKDFKKINQKIVIFYL